MPKPFDARLNQLIDGHAGDWSAMLCARLGIPSASLELLDTDLATTLQADKVFRLGGPQPSVIHLELESNPRRGIPAELLRYHAHIAAMYGLPVDSVIILLRPKANALDLTGTHEAAGGDGRTNLTFRYTVIRLWQEPMAPLLNGGIGTLPLALLTDEAEADMQAAVRQFRQHLHARTVADTVKDAIVEASTALLELRLDPAQIKRLYEDSTVPLEETVVGKLMIATATGKHVMRIAARHLGPPPDQVKAVIADIDDIDRLERMFDRAFDVTSWEDLLATP